MEVNRDRIEVKKDLISRRQLKLIETEQKFKEHHFQLIKAQ